MKKNKAVNMGINNYKTILYIIFVLSIILIRGQLLNSEEDSFNLIEINGPISPVVSEFILESIDKSIEENVKGLIIELDTPGGLLESTRDIVKKMVNAPLPIIVFVSPSGARAASAGVMITLASDIAVMAPGTNIGAAHPVSIGTDQEKIDEAMKDKILNDTVAYIKGIAKRRNRNEEWAEKAVRESVSITSEEALKEGVIDLISTDIDDLLKKIDGLEIEKVGLSFKILSKGSKVKKLEMGVRQKILNALSDPNIAYILMMIGIWGLFFELSNPGVIFPGVIGGICLILAFFAFQTLPVDYAGIALILLSLILFIAEIKVISHGILTLGGIISLILGSLMLFDSSMPYFKVSLSNIIFSAIFTGLVMFGVMFLVVKAQLRKPETGIEGLIGEIGEVIVQLNPKGKVFVRGEYWDAISKEPVEKGERVKVLNINNLLLTVERKERES